MSVHRPDEIERAAAHFDGLAKNESLSPIKQKSDRDAASRLSKLHASGAEPGWHDRALIEQAKHETSRGPKGLKWCPNCGQNVAPRRPVKPGRLVLTGGTAT